MRTFLRRVLGLGAANVVSDRWLTEQARRESRIEFHGVRWKFPIQKRLNEAGQFNRQKLRRSA